MTSELTRPRSGPVRFELVDHQGYVFGPFESAEAAAPFGREGWPMQEQDPGRTGKGWDIQTVGAE